MKKDKTNITNRWIDSNSGNVSKVINSATEEKNAEVPVADDTELLRILPTIGRALYSRLNQEKLTEVELNITPRCFDIMRLLLEEGPMNISEAGKRLHISKAQMTQLVAKLIKQRMIEKNVKETDKRNNILSVNKLGEKTMKAHMQNWENASREIMTSLSKRDQRELIKLLHKLQEILENV